MTDTISPERRSWNMSRIGSKDTKPELLLRRQLHSLGLRYRLHDKTLPGKPDVVFRAKKIAIQVRGCFWHGHVGCKKSRLPKSNVLFWSQKQSYNRTLDSENDAALTVLGFNLFVVWECDVQNSDFLRDFANLVYEAHKKQV